MEGCRPREQRATLVLHPCVRPSITASPTIRTTRWWAWAASTLVPVGSRIVAETIIGVLWCDKTSFLHDMRGFQPLPEITGGKEMTIAALLKIRPDLGPAKARSW